MIYDLTNEAENYLGLSPLPSQEVYFVARVIELGLSPSESVVYTLGVRKEIARLNQMCDAESNRSKKNMAYVRNRKW